MDWHELALGLATIVVALCGVIVRFLSSRLFSLEERVEELEKTSKQDRRHYRRWP